MRNGLLIFLCIISGIVSGQTSYEKAWNALNTNNWKEAAGLLKETMQGEQSFTDAYISNLYLETYMGKEDKVLDFYKTFYQRETNPYPYIYALWFNQAVAGNYSKKTAEHQLSILHQLVKDQKAAGTLAAAAHYQLGMHYTFSNDFEKAKRSFEQVGNILNWQYVGPFENLSESGYYKNYGPLEHPEPGSVFKSITNAEVKWFSPSDEVKEGWSPVRYQFNNTTAIVYAQTFVNAANDQSILVNAGATGSLKVWLNDELIIAEPKERSTELDTYTSRCSLKKGVNRVLVQLGYTDNTYPNFSIRLTDEQNRPVPGISGSKVYAPYPKVAQPGKGTAQIKLFAESFFQDRIAKSPANLINYLLLADVYLRNSKVIEARNLVTDAIKLAPDNCLLKMKMTEVLIKENNRTLLLEEVEKIKQLDPESLLVIELNIKDLMDGQKYEDAMRELDKRVRLYGEDENTASYKLSLLAYEKKFDELVKEVERLYTKYPTSVKILELMYEVKKNVYKNNKEANEVFESYLKNNYNYSVLEKYASILTEQGDDKKALQIKQKVAENFPYSPEEFYNLSLYHFGTKQYDKAQEYIKKTLELAPYNEVYWEKLGDIQNEKKNLDEAMRAYKNSLQYDPNQYAIINKVRKLDGKPEYSKLFSEADIDALVKEDKISEARNTDFGYYYILDKKDVILFPGGATEEYITILIRITNEKGIDRYKESSISYGNSQTLLIEKAEVIKKNMTRIEGEKNDNEIVFPNLEAGDVIVYKYRLRSYVYGRFGKEYWDTYYFGGQIFTVTTKYTILVPAEQKLHYQFLNAGIQPVVSNVENFKQYSWEMSKAEPDKEEPLMPALADVAAILHLTTVASWKEISDWYSDVSNNKAEEDFEIIQLYSQLFPDPKKQMTQYQKAKIIYNYLESNIRYSSVSFRQSAFVPQRPSVTLTTRLGDCKDLSSLFVTLAQMAGINARMVLVDTRDNGQKHIVLPSVEFNHCIVKAELDNKSYYIELTDNYLPFASVPNNLVGAAILEIPARNHSEKPELKFLQADNRIKDQVKRVIDIKANDADLEINVRTVKFGSSTSSVRYNYLNLDNEKQMKEMEKSVAGGYKNNLKMLNVNFIGLDKLEDSVLYTYNFRVKNEISEIGSIKTFRVVYPDVVATLDHFSADTRVYPVNYWGYEDMDSYETTVNISIPAGKKFIELPASESHSFKEMKFSIQYILKSPDKLVVVRKFSNKRQQIEAADYPACKAFFEKIVKAEQKFIAFK